MNTTAADPAWLQLTFELTPADTDAFSDVLTECGAQAVTISDAADQPLLEPVPGSMPLWDALLISGLFKNDITPETLINTISSRWHKILPDCSIERFQDQIWERVWMTRFKPMLFGKRLWICPSWLKVEEKDAVILTLDPGMAFGTGTHETTALCLEWLDDAELENKSCLDFGCGSGILAIAAAKLGAKGVTGIDIDEQAIIATRQNAELNHLENEIETSLADTADTRERDIVLANVLAKPLCSLHTAITASVRPGGILIMSGVLSEQADEVMQVYQHDFAFEPVIEKNGWVRLEGRKHAYNNPEISVY